MGTNVLIYCGDVLGLGHQRRNTTIAAEIVRKLPDANVVLLSSLHAGFIECPERVDVVKLPSLRKLEGGAIGARTLGLAKDELLRLRRGIIDGVARELRPDMVLVDHKPTGVWGELLPSLEEWSRRPDRPLTLLGVRDILDRPTVTVRRWRRSGIYDAIRRYYDRVLIYGSPEVYETRKRYRLDSQRAEYCGYICPANGFLGKEVVRQQLGLGSNRVVVVSAGGGVDGFPMMRDCVRAVRALSRPDGVEFVFVAGPFMQPEHRSELLAELAGLRARLFQSSDQLPELFEAADLVVTMAGYNSVLEAVRQRKPTLVIPRPGPSEEQRIRSRRLHDRGTVIEVATGDRTPERLARLLEETLERPFVPTPLPGADGLEVVAEKIVAMLADRTAALAEAGRKRATGARR